MRTLALTRSVTLALLALAPLLARADETIVQQATLVKPVPDGGLYLGWGGGLSPDTGNAGIGELSLVVDRPLFWRLGLWVSGESSLVFKQPEPDLALRLCFGVRADLYRSPEKRVRLITTVSFAHQHEAPVSGWAANPGSNLLGESKDGLGHRSGLGVGAGLLLTPWIDRPGFSRRVRILLRLDGVWLPDDAGPNFFLSFLTSVGVAL